MALFATALFASGVAQASDCTIHYSGFSNAGLPLERIDCRQVINDTGVDWCTDGSSHFEPCGQVDYPGQDGDFGRDALAAQDNLPKQGSGVAGFDYTKIDADGLELPSSASVWSCVRDNHTGLIWEVKTTDDGPRDRSRQFTWFNPDSTENGGVPGDDCPAHAICDTHDYQAYVNELALCGRTNWRLPSRIQLRSLVYHGASDGGVGMDESFFPNYVSANYWSATTLAENPDRAWELRFYDGRFGTTGKILDRAVRLVAP
jgi:hypothetical protein